MKKNIVINLLLIGVLAQAPAQALLISGPDIISAPSSIVDDLPGAVNDRQQGFNERSRVLLTSNLSVDAGSGSIAAGTWVDSQMIFLNTLGNVYAADLDVEWVFDNIILGVMSDVSANRENASNGFLGAIGTSYPGSFDYRGMEGADNYQVNGNTLTVSMYVSEPGDWIRVITASVPEPSILFLLLGGFVLLQLSRRKPIM